MDGLLRYNAIQSALSPLRKAYGWKLPVGGFQEIASKIYQKTKGEPLKGVINSIDIILEEIPKEDPPFLPVELTELNDFYNFDGEANHGNGVVFPEDFSENLYFKSPQLFGAEDYAINTSLLNYDDHFQRFSDYCNANKGYWWTDSTNAPKFRFTEPKYNWSEQKWLTFIELGQDDGYGYDPEIGTVVNPDVVIKPLIEEETAPEPEPEPEPVKPSEKELEIQKIKAQTELEKASTEKLTQLNAAMARLDSQLDRGLITKKEYQKYLKKIMEL